MPRKAKGTGPGRASKFQGEKLEWLLAWEDEWRTTDDRGAFYNKVTKLFCQRYGYDLAFEVNIEGSLDDWIPVDRKAGLSGDLLIAENDFQEDKRAALRTILANWYRHKFKGKRLHGAALGQILKTMLGMAGSAARPRRKTPVAFYSHKYYVTRVKDKFDAVWAAAKGALPQTARISMCQEYVKACLEGESAEFKAKLEEDADEEHAAAMRKYKETHTTVAKTAEAYHEYAHYLLLLTRWPLADALAEYTGMHVAILMVGPVGEQRGEIRLRSVFSDTTPGQISKVWGQFERDAFTAAEASLTRYGRRFFSKEECRARAWPPLECEGLISMETDTDPLPAPNATPSHSLPVAPAATPAAPLASVPPAPTVATPAADVVMTPIVPGQSGEEDTYTPPLDAAPPEEKYWGWCQTQIDVYELMEEKKDWGPRWKELIDAVVAFEESTLHSQGKFPPAKNTRRPKEIAAWMKDHRKPGDWHKLDAGFGERLAAWWGNMIPIKRQQPRPEDLSESEPWPMRGAHQDPETFSWADWVSLRQSGDNGMLLVVQALTWWGQSIVNEGASEGLGGGEEALAGNAEWQALFEDVLWSLVEMTDPLDAKTRAELAEEKAAHAAGRAVRPADDDDEFWEGNRGRKGVAIEFDGLEGGASEDRNTAESQRWREMKEKQKQALIDAAASKERMDTAIEKLRVEKTYGGNTGS
ncbi:hypothetical protein C8R43DRAFT_941243 [Mycena crocata]|nr:hypothetical protein C8R43DRAFT_941243 [Mycena crocata]